MRRSLSNRLFLGFFGFLFFLAGCSSTVSTSSSTSMSGCAPDEESCAQEERNEAKILSKDFEPMSFEEAIAFFEDKQSGLLYFGFPNCPWCQEVVPVLHELASQAHVPVHYIQTRDDEGIRLYTDSQRDDIAPYLNDFIRNNAKGEPTLYVPLVLAVEDGQVIQGHQGSISGHNAHEEELTSAQKQELQEDLKELVTLVGQNQEKDLVQN